jgi:transcriptional regulator with XRE-family HTH domain
VLRPRKQVIRNSEAYTAFVTSLLDRRQRLTLTQQQVADGINLSRSQYTALENGRSMVTFDHLCSLAEFFGTTLSRLLDGVGPMPRAPGTRVIICKCGRRVTFQGLPDEERKCPGCLRRVKLPQGKSDEPKSDHRS